MTNGKSIYMKIFFLSAEEMFVRFSKTMETSFLIRCGSREALQKSQHQHISLLSHLPSLQPLERILGAKPRVTMNLAFAHEPGTAISCLSIPIILHKEGAPGVAEIDLKCGFKIGGGIDQDYRKSPQVMKQTTNLPVDDWVQISGLR